MNNSPSVSNTDRSMTDYDYNEDGIRAKGTFVDPDLRNLEKVNGLPELLYHGFVDMKMSSNLAQHYDVVFKGKKNKICTTISIVVFPRVYLVFYENTYLRA